MLTGPLLITTFRQGKAYPYKLTLKESSLELASNLIQLFQSSIGNRRFEIEDEIKAYHLEASNPKIVEGMAKILFQRSEFSHQHIENPEGFRNTIYSQSANYWRNNPDAKITFDQHKSKILSPIEGFEKDWLDATELLLFSDISSNQKMTGFESIKPENLIHRFNIEQVQGLLISAKKMELRIQKQSDATLRQVLQMMKFFRLIYTLDSLEDDSIHLTIDGPGSILENGRSYGLELAQFFPAILLLQVEWELKATLEIRNRPRNFFLEINQKNPYQTHYTAKGIWKHERIEQIVSRFNEKYQDQYKATLEPSLISLPHNYYLLPDFKVTLKKGKKTKPVMFEWIRYFTDKKLEWLRQLEPHLPDNYVFIVKGKKNNFKELEAVMGKRLLRFTSELTAPSIKKRINET